MGFFPIVALQGARQTGKSFLIKQILAPHYKKSRYVTFDDEGVRSSATESAKTFLNENESFSPFLIDEAQKVPALFDALKLKVDQNKVPGKYVILGSTEFSKQTLIRESLTGRMGKVRIFPLNIAETIGLENKRKPIQQDLLKYLEHGGLPGICFVRDVANRDALFQDWVDLTCYRDLQQFKKLKLDGEIAFQVLKQTALLAEPTQSEIAKALRVNARKVGTYLEALKQLFVISSLSPHPSGTGKQIFIPFDCGIAHFLGASRIRCLQVWLLNEKLVHDSCSHSKRSQFFYYRSTNKKMIHLVEVRADQSIVAHQLIAHEAIKKIDSELMKAFLKKNEGAKGFVLAPVSEKMKLNEITYMPWESGTV